MGVDTRYSILRGLIKTFINNFVFGEGLGKANPIKKRKMR
jgi:hypothetical protein